MRCAHTSSMGHGPSRGGKGGYSKEFSTERPTPRRSNPLPFYIPFLTEKVPLSYTFYWQMAPHTVEPLLWDTSVQGTPPFTGYKIGSWKTFHKIFVSVTSIKETHLFRGKGPSFWVPKPGFWPTFRGHLSRLTANFVFQAFERNM